MKLKINESKTFEFEMDTSGCSWKELQGYFRLTFENVEYGFPVKVEEGILKVDIPVFEDILHEGIMSSLQNLKEISVDARLDLIANNEAYINPWSGKIDIEVPVSVKLTENKEVKNKLSKQLKASPEVKIVDPDIKEYIEEEKKVKEENPEKIKEQKIVENQKNKSRFSIMMEDDDKNCPDGQKY